MDNSYYVKRSRQSIADLAVDLAINQVRDSKIAYLWIAIFSFLYILISWALLTWRPESFYKLNVVLLKESGDIFNIFPPFLLAIVAIFPSFSDSAKTKLKELNKKKQPRVAPFLNQFVFLILLSLAVLILSKLLIGFEFFKPKMTQVSDHHFWQVTIGCLFFTLLMALLWEVLDSIKSLYILILRDYF